ncbi:hypothetical protein PIB30_079871 [Stylosanthes scabra]|uniref:USP domain-containing protein n=1 Tax=Stylosanthes scabra TaxID=79078 RepID=A0ABU6YRJ6_9FABA|nr:hypothetical protein [Stylosanthes scabra]
MSKLYKQKLGRKKRNAKKRNFPPLASDLSGKEYPNPSISDPALSIPKLPELDEALEEPEEIGLIDNSSSDNDEDDEADPHSPRGAFDDDDDLYRCNMFSSSIHEDYDDTFNNDINSSDGPSSPSVGAGIRNLGNTCYVNAILQCLTHTVVFVEAIRSCNHITPCIAYGQESGSYCAICALRDTMNGSLQIPRHPITPERLVEELNYFSPLFAKGIQGDGHEFMQCLFEKVIKHSPKGANPIDTVFGGKLVSLLNCCECGESFSEKEERVTDISLEIDNLSTLESALNSFTKLEIIDDTKVDIERNAYRKIVEEVHYPFVLDLTDYTHKKEEMENFKYDLYGIVVHQEVEMMVTITVMSVSQVDEINALDDIKGAYLLFYARQGTPWFLSSVDRLENPKPK